MAIPEDMNTVTSTTLPDTHVRQLLGALDRQSHEINYISSSLYNQSNISTIDYRGAQYEVHEWCEEVNHIDVVSGETDILRGFLALLETDLIEAIENQEFLRADTLHKKIQKLKRLL